MKYALIGCGRIATNHVKAVVNNDLDFLHGHNIQFYLKIGENAML